MALISTRRALLGGGRLLPFSDTFDRDNGTLGGRWQGGANWAIVGNEAVNSPVGLGELLTDPGLESNYTAGYCDTFAAKSGAPNVAQSADVHGGAKAQQFQGTAQFNRINYPAGANHVAGIWYRASLWAKRTAGATSDVYSALFDGVNYQVLLNGGISYLTSVAYAQHLRTFRGVVTSTIWRVAHTDSAAGYDTVIVDDLSLQELALSDLISAVNVAAANVAVWAELDTIVSGTQAGIVLNLDSATTPANFVLGTHNGTLAKLIKCVAGTYTELISAAAAYAAGPYIQVIKSGTSYSLYYNGVQIGATQTVADAGIINNTWHGMFSTYNGNQLDNFSIVRA